jgi:hypothetical protein
MTTEEREAFSKYMHYFHHNTAGEPVTTSRSNFQKKRIPTKTIYCILDKYLKYGIEKGRPRSSRPVKLSGQK